MSGRLLCLCLLLLGTVRAQPDSLAAESHQARQLMAAGRFAEAVPIYSKLVEAMPGNPGLRLNLAMALHLSGQDEKAIPQFEAVLKQQPDALPALMLLGASYMRTGSPGKAVAPLEKAVAQAPDDLEGRAMLADALILLNRYQRALPHLRKLAAANPDQPRPWYSLGKAYESLAQEAFGTLEKQNADSPYWLDLAADARLKLGRYTAAFILYRAVLEKQPTFRGAHAGLAEVYRKTSHADWAAIEDAKEKALPPGSCSTPSVECSFAKGQFEQALNMALQQKSAAGLYWQTKAANELARAAFARLTSLPPSVESYTVTAELLRNQGRHAEAIEQWRAAIAIAPDDARLQQELVTSIYMNRDYAMAETMARKMLSNDPNVAELQFILGDSLVNLQKLEQSLGPLGQAVRLRPDYAAAQAVLGRALLQLDRAREAVPHLKAALSADSDGGIHFQLARAYQVLGEEQLAQAELKTYQAIKKANDSQEIEIVAPQR